MALGSKSKDASVRAPNFRLSSKECIIAQCRCLNQRLDLPPDIASPKGLLDGKDADDAIGGHDAKLLRSFITWIVRKIVNDDVHLTRVSVSHFFDPTQIIRAGFC